jgi:hypothetical protein
MARKLPNPADRSEAEPAVLCGSHRVKELYKTATGDTARRVSKKVREWFLATAKEEGWDGAIFINDVQTRHSSGCVLYKRFNPKVEINLWVSGVEEE